MAGPRTATESLRWSAALDNHEPTRDFAMGTGLIYPPWPDQPRSTTITLLGVNELKDAEKAVYLLDDGSTVTAWYVAGWAGDPNKRGALNPDKPELHLQQFPVNPDGDTRPDGRVVDFGTWQLGPRRAYHLKITLREVITFADEDGELPLTGGGFGNPGCDCGMADAVVKVGTAYLCQPEAKRLGITA